MSAPKWDGLILARNGALEDVAKIQKLATNLCILDTAFQLGKWPQVLSFF